MNSKDCVYLSTFDYGINFGNLITGSDYIWCVNSKDAGLQIRNIKNKFEISSPYHNFGIASKEKYTIVCAKDFEFNQQHFLLVSLEINSNEKRYLLALFQISISKVICSFEVPHNVTKIEILVKNKHFIDNNKNPSILRNFDVTAVCACNGGSIYLFDITPQNEFAEWNSDEYSPLKVYWYKSIDFTDYDEIIDEKRMAFAQSQIFGLHLNYKSTSKENFNYIMPNDKLIYPIPSNDVKITSIKYEKQIDSLLVGFNFGCFQIWNLKTQTIEISTGYGENTRPIVGFSLLQPQNDPKKCLYLLVTHSSVVNSMKSQEKPAEVTNLNKSRKSLVENELNKIGNINETRNGDDDGEDANDCSFILLYQLMFDKCVNVFLNQNESYHLYESIQNSAIVFQHDFTSDTLKCVKTNNLNEINNLKSNQFIEEEQEIEEDDSSLSKIISIQTINIPDKQSHMDLACIIWTLMDVHSPCSSVKYYLSIFNLNNWYVRCMPAKMKHLTQFDSNGKCLKRMDNIYFSNFSLPINDDFDTMKLISVIDAKLKKQCNQNSLSYGNHLKSLINSNSSDDIYENDEECREMTSLESDTVLSMSFDIVVLTSFSLIKLMIKPIEHEIHDLISNQEDLIHNPDVAYDVLCHFHLIDKYINKTQGKFIQIFDYLFETSQIYVILKSLWILNSEDTCVISDFSLKVVLDWSWSKFTKIKIEINKIYKIISTQLYNYQNHLYQFSDEIEHEHLSEFLQRQNNQLDNLIQIYKQFIKLNSSHQGQIELNKKLCLIECLKCYVEHLNLFHKYELLLPPELTLNSDVNKTPRNRNLVKEMDVNFRIITNRWFKRRQSDSEENKYPFTFMIDCLIEECKLNSNVTKFLLNELNSEDAINNFYPPRSINDLLEICLESNLSTKLKQIIILYVLCDLMHTELFDDVKKQVLKIINAYCSASFTIMSTTLDASLSVPWSSSSTSIIAVGNDNSDNPNNSSCLFDLVNGLYLIDSRHIEKAFNYLRTAEINYLELYEKYFILYNSLNAKEYKLAIQYLWLFQKLNTSTITSMDSIRSNQPSLVNKTNVDQNFFRFFNKSNSSSDLTKTTNCLKRNEQYMHLRVMITIYLANSLWNEAFEFIKPYLKAIKTVSSDSLGKEIVIHFFLECEKFGLTRQIAKCCVSNQDLIEIFLCYLETKQDLSSISLAINLHIENRNYSRACYLFNKHNKAFVNSGDSYLASLIDEIKNENSNGIAENSKHLNLINQEDIKNTLSYQYKFTQSINELCKNSKRCIKILSTDSDDTDYINLMKLPEQEQLNPNMTVPSANLNTNKIEETLLSKTSLDFSILKRTSSTPQSVFASKKQRTSPILKSLSNQLMFSESKASCLASSLKNKTTNSVSKSVKFLGSRTTRRISENERYVDKEEELDILETELQNNKTLNVNLFLNDEEDEKLKENKRKSLLNEPQVIEQELNESFKAAKAEIESEIFSSKIEFKTDLHLFSCVTPTKTCDKEHLKNTMSLPVNRAMKSSMSEEQTVQNYSNNISMEECIEVETTKLEQETTIKEQRKAEIGTELYNAKMNFKANLSFFNSVTPGRLDNNKQQKNLDFKNSLSMPANRFVPEKPSIEQVEQQQIETQADIVNEVEQIPTVVTETIELKETPEPIEQIEIPQEKEEIISAQTESDDELADLVPELVEEDSNECAANKTELNDVTIKPEAKLNEDTETESLSNQLTTEEAATNHQQSNLNDSVTSSVLIDCTLDQDTIESETKDDKDADNSSNASFDLNMSSISATNSPTKLNLIKPTDDKNFKKISRNSSSSSLSSHVSSVSQQFEETTAKRETRKKIQPSTRNKDVRLMDDNELSIKKATEEAIGSGAGKASLRRRKSDLSSTSSSSSASTANLEAVAKLRASLQQIPSKFGSNDQEVRMTRSKLKALIEPTDELFAQDTPTKPSVTRTKSTRGGKKKLEQLNENEEIKQDESSQPKMSISNLKKHNAAIEKMDAIAGLTKQNEVEDPKVVTVKKSGSVRKTRQTARSPSPTASSCVSESTIASVVSTTTSTKTRKGSKAKAATKQEVQEVENDSPTSSVASAASTSSRYSMRERRSDGASSTATATKETASSKSAASTVSRTISTRGRKKQLEQLTENEEVVLD